MKRVEKKRESGYLAFVTVGLVACLTFASATSHAAKRRRPQRESVASAAATDVAPSDMIPPERKQAREAFTLKRYYEHYFVTLGERLESSLRALVKGHAGTGHWIDMEAGRATAQKPNAIGGEMRPPDLSGIERTAIAKRAPAPVDEIYKSFGQAGPSERFRYLEGDVLKFTPGQMKQADLITDVYGPLSQSSHDVPKLLEQYGRFLKPVGRLVSHFVASSFGLRDAAGKNVSVKSYLESVSGLKLVSFQTQSTPVAPMYQFVLERTEGEVKAPKLELLEFTPQDKVYGDDFPRRVYRIAQDAKATAGARYMSADFSELVQKEPARLVDAKALEKILAESDEGFKLNLLHYAKGGREFFAGKASLLERLRDPHSPLAGALAVLAVDESRSVRQSFGELAFAHWNLDTDGKWLNATAVKHLRRAVQSEDPSSLYQIRLMAVLMRKAGRYAIPLDTPAFLQTLETAIDSGESLRVQPAASLLSDWIVNDPRGLANESVRALWKKSLFTQGAEFYAFSALDEAGLRRVARTKEERRAILLDVKADLESFISKLHGEKIEPKDGARYYQRLAHLEISQRASGRIDKEIGD